mmetsp:Transcript_66727/g.118409  ORF Transcript_66727/g.118409 Transcript_66727/m.118409 type:complete len:260 (-) Transcript_66727:1098-1877(-)
MSAQHSLVDSNYQDMNKHDLVSYGDGDTEMKDANEKSNETPTNPLSKKDESMTSMPPPLPPGFFSNTEARVDFQINGVFPEATKERCSEKLQAKINSFLEKVKRGEVPTPVRHIRSTKNFNNPEILSEIVSQFEIVQQGTHMKSDVWDPFGFPKEDYIEVLQQQGAPKPAPASTPLKDTPGAAGVPPTPPTPAATVARSTIITRKSSVAAPPAAARPIAAVPGVMPNVLLPGGSAAHLTSLAQYAAALTQQGFGGQAKK